MPGEHRAEKLKKQSRRGCRFHCFFRCPLLKSSTQKGLLAERPFTVVSGESFKGASKKWKRVESKIKAPKQLWLTTQGQEGLHKGLRI